MKRTWVWLLGAWALWICLTTPALGAVSTQEVQSLVDRFGKEALIDAVLKLRENQITIEVRGRFREFMGPPSPEFVTIETLVRDVNQTSLNEAGLEAFVQSSVKSSAGTSQLASSKRPAPGSSSPSRNPLWSVKKGKNTLYLLGSLHILKADSYPLSGRIERAYADCQRVAFETDIGETESPAVLKRMMELGVYPGDKTLSEQVSAETYDLFREEIRSLGLPMDPFDRFRPWFSAVTIVAMELRRLGFDPAYGIDQYFFEKAKQDGKDLVYLETLDEQLELFANMNEREQEAFLRQTLKDLEIVEEMANDMVDAWKTGDMDRLGSILQKSFKDHPGLYERFVTKRNRAWIKHIEDLMSLEQDILVVVGAGHLAGPESLIALLQARGHKVVQR